MAIYRRRVFKMSWLWQDMRAMHPKSPANRRRGIHHVNILPGRGPFRCTGPSNHARRADLATIQRSQGLAHGRQEGLGIASALRIAADGPTPWSRTFAAAVRDHGNCRSVAGGATHDRQCCGERTVQHCVCASCPAASARPQRVSCQRHPPARSNLRRRRFSAAARPMTAACPHSASCSTAVARTSSVGGASPDATQKTASVCWPFFLRL